MSAAIVFCIIFSQAFFSFGCFPIAQKANGQSGATAVARTNNDRVWRAATYHGLTMGRSNVDEMRRILGAPKRSEVLSEGKSISEVWYHYDGPQDFAGTFRVIVDGNIVQAVDILPKDLKAEEAIKHFGPDYIITRYDFDSCLGDEESAPLFESPNGAVIYIEYRERGIAIAVTGTGNVNEVRYVSKPIGAESSKCKQVDP
ncbi:MAG TPA: hypothetical protein VFR78_22470 [Pyrinomonadaceae bacterium]|nr:hypothetical protein [Pyrinomonadaceae bacterium]